MRIGITGHQRLKNLSDWDWIKEQMDSTLREFPRPVIGVTSLAIGADQLFAKTILEHQGIIEAIIPFEGYELKFAQGADREAYQHLLRSASRIEILTKAESDEESYRAAGIRVADISEMLMAVWDGRPAGGLGGTADIVAYARQQGKKILHFNPITHSVVQSN